MMKLSIICSLMFVLLLSCSDDTANITGSTDITDGTNDTIPRKVKSTKQYDANNTLTFSIVYEFNSNNEHSKSTITYPTYPANNQYTEYEYPNSSTVRMTSYKSSDNSFINLTETKYRNGKVESTKQYDDNNTLTFSIVYEFNSNNEHSKSTITYPTYPANNQYTEYEYPNSS